MRRAKQIGALEDIHHQRLRGRSDKQRRNFRAIRLVDHNADSGSIQQTRATVRRDTVT